MTQETFMVKDYEVHTYDTDVSRHLSFVALCNYLQDAAASHAVQLQVGYHDLKQQRLAWVLRQMRVVTTGRAAWGDTVRIETWPRRPDRLLAHRDFLVFNGKGEEIARATTSWLIIDAEQRKHIRLDPAMFEHYTFREQEVFSEPMRSLPKVKDTTKVFGETVRYTHLDMNNHVNNVVYIRWIMDAHQKENGEVYPSHFEIQHGHEILLGQEAGIYMHRGEDFILYQVKTEGSGQTAATGVVIE
jgi:acyl-ACP thioesterase